MDDVTRETSLLIKALGVVIGECLFGLYGPLLFIHPLRWFEINFPDTIAIGALSERPWVTVWRTQHWGSAGAIRHPAGSGAPWSSPHS